MSRPRIFAIVVILADTREPGPSSTFPAAPAIETTGETVEETTRPAARPLAKVLPFVRSLRKVG